MSIEEQIKQKLEEAIDILKKFGMPSAQQNERTAYCLLSLLNVTPEKEWKNAENPLVGITPMMTFAKEYYNKEYAPNTDIHISTQANTVSAHTCKFWA
jgi:type II restriction enzyme